MQDPLDEISTNPSNKKLVIMPLTRVLFEEKFSIGWVYFYPPGQFDFDSLRPAQNRIISDVEDVDHGISCLELEGQNLREIATSITGFSIEILRTHHVVAFTYDIEWSEFLENSHDADIELIRGLSEKVESVFDVIRFDYCRFDLPDTLPGLVGSWEDSGQFLGAMLYTADDNESYLIAGATIETSVVVKGIGLEIMAAPKTPLINAGMGEVSAIVVHGLSIFSDVMRASNDTIKFIRAMTLLEFLASPDNARSWKKLKGDIICHCVKDKTSYIKLSKRFQELTSIVDSKGLQRGLRTLIVHQGNTLTELIPNIHERKGIFRELQFIAGKILLDMIRHKNYTWSDFGLYRDSLKQDIGIV